VDGDGGDGRPVEEERRDAGGKTRIVCMAHTDAGDICDEVAHVLILRRGGLSASAGASRVPFR
jgi:hypothetical protein